MYHYTQNGERHQIKELKDRIYFAVGFQGDKPGSAFFVGFGPVLIPLYHNNGKRVIQADKAGKTLRNGELTNG